MPKVTSVENIRRIEAAADASGLSYAAMMQNAGRAVAHRTLKLLSKYAAPQVTVLVGPGNNGGDGLVAGLIIANESKAQVHFYLLKSRSDDDQNYAAVRDAGLFIAVAENDPDFRILRNMVASSDFILDAMYGIGVKLPLQNEVTRLLRNIWQALNDIQQTTLYMETIVTPAVPEKKPRHVQPYVIAVDCPSGLDCDTGEFDASGLVANETVTFIAAKPGLFEFPGAAAVGELSIASIGLPDSLTDLDSEKRFVVDSYTVRRLLPKRPLNANKGTFGKVLIIAGSTNYIGAAGLAALSTYRVGAGLVTVGAIRPVIEALSGRLLEVTWLPLDSNQGHLIENAAQIIRQELPNYDVLLLGPGWGRHAGAKDFLIQLLSYRKLLPRLVLDADALNLLSEVENWWTILPPDTIITPHPGEMARLAKLEVKEIQSNRWSLVVDKARDWRAVLILKGAHTLIASPGGEVAVLPFKTDALAKAGTGDVLAGIVTGLCAQGLASFSAAFTGGYLHGLAGELAARRVNHRSVFAGEIIDLLGEAIRLVEETF